MTEPAHHRDVPPARTRARDPASQPGSRVMDAPGRHVGTGEQATAMAGRSGAADGPPASTASQAGTETSDGTGSAQPGAQAGPADLLPSITHPKGGGAIRGLDEKFSVNAATGTASMAVPLPFSPGRSGFTPPLRLSYDSGSGNGPFGFGWSLGLPAITRKTDKGLPALLRRRGVRRLHPRRRRGPGAGARRGRRPD